MNKKYRIDESSIGIGLFATGAFSPTDTILEIQGNLLHWRVLLGLSGIIQDNTFRFNEEYYLSPSAEGNYLNHSCKPNSGIYKENGRLMLRAITKIKSGDEIMIDYSTMTGNDDSWVMKCKCGQKMCRTLIKSLESLPLRIKQKYIRLGIVPDYIINS